MTTTTPFSRIAPHLLSRTCRAFIHSAEQLAIRPPEAEQTYKAFHRLGSAPPGITPPAPSRTTESGCPEGTVRKFIMRLPLDADPRLQSESSSPAPHAAPPAIRDQATHLETESVVIPMIGRNRQPSYTLCVSSQVGCAMGCDFCETAQMGLVRNLAAGEIVAQWHAARHALAAPIQNIVFMGMGEPLDNARELFAAIEILTDHRGPSVAMRRITISTVGRTDALAELRDRVQTHGWRQLNLAVSINAPNDRIRSSIMPINKSMPLTELIPLLESWPRRSSDAICAEYVLIPGVNDADDHADQLAVLLKNIRCCVNVIPYNPRRNSPWPAPTEASVERFIARLSAAGQFTKRRRTKGRDTMSACGQLGNESIRNRNIISPILTPSRTTPRVLPRAT